MSRFGNRIVCFGKFYFFNCVNSQLSGRFNCSRRQWVHTSSILNVVGQEVKMPSLSPTMSEGKIIKWLKKEGDSIKPGDLLCEIQTDKAVMAFEFEEEGILAKIMVKEDTDVKVGTLIALMVEEGDDWKSVEIPSGNNLKEAVSVSSGTSTSASTSVVEEVPSSTSVPFTGTEVKMPSLSPTMTEGTIVRWLKKEGDKVCAGDALCEIQTDKAVMAFEIEEEGILAKILAGDNTSNVKVGTIIALIVDEGEDWQNVTVPTVSSDQRENRIEHDHVKDSQLGLDSTKSIHIGPSVRLLLEQFQLDKTKIQGSGSKHTILKKDVLQYIKDHNLSPQPPIAVPLPSRSVIREEEELSTSVEEEAATTMGYIDRKISNMRSTIAKRLTQSKTEIPHSYAAIESNIDGILKIRNELKTAGINVSLNDFVIKAVAAALAECPFMNSLFINGNTTPAPGIDVSIAVATPDGLITPIVKSANVKTVMQIAEEVKDLAARARSANLKLNEFQGGSFTISNLGMFGIDQFSAIINPPQCGILAVGCGIPTLKNEEELVTQMISTLSFDARVVDDFGANEFLSAYKSYLESPSLLLASLSRKL